MLVLDFDVGRSFVLLGNPETPAGVHGVNFTPTIRVTGMDVAASISGTLTTEEEGVSVEGHTVVAEPADGGIVPGYQTETGTAVTAEDGTYTIFFLVPGTYDVSVDLPAGLASAPSEDDLGRGASFRMRHVCASYGRHAGPGRPFDGMPLRPYLVGAGACSEEYASRRSGCGSALHRRGKRNNFRTSRGGS